MSASLEGKTYVDIDQRELVFVSDGRPSLRCLSWHYVTTILRALTYGDQAEVTQRFPEWHQHTLPTDPLKTASDDTPLPSNREKFKAYVRGLEHGWHSTKMDRCVEIIGSRLKDGSGSEPGRILVFLD